MSVHFLSADQQKRFGLFAGEPTADQLARYFHLDETDHHHIRARHGDHNKLGFALQLCTVRFLGTFLTQATNVPAGVVAYLARQLAIADPSCLRRYLNRIRRRHVREISELYGYHQFHGPRQHN